MENRVISVWVYFLFQWKVPQKQGPDHLHMEDFELLYWHDIHTDR